MSYVFVSSASLCEDAAGVWSSKSTGMSAFPDILRNSYGVPGSCSDDVGDIRREYTLLLRPIYGAGLTIADTDDLQFRAH